jgi:uncharacterized protein (TIRG00374 family)
MRQFAVRLLVSVLALAALLWLVDLAELGQLLASIHPGWAAAVVIFCTLDRVVMSWKWTLLLRAGGVRAGFGQALKTYYVGNFFGSFLPSTVGADVLRAWRLSALEGRAATVISSIILERVLGFLALAVFCVMSLALLAVVVKRHLGALLLVDAAAMGAAIALTALALGRWEMLRRWLSQSRSGALRKLGAFYDALGQFRSSRGALAIFLAASVAEVLLPVAANWAGARSLGLANPFWHFVLLIPVTLLVARIPVSLDGIGVQEGAYVALFAMLGTPPASALALGLVQRILTLLSTTPGLVFYLRPESINLE